MSLEVNAETGHVDKFRNVINIALEQDVETDHRSLFAALAQIHAFIEENAPDTETVAKLRSEVEEILSEETSGQRIRSVALQIRSRLQDAFGEKLSNEQRVTLDTLLESTYRQLIEFLQSHRQQRKKFLLHRGRSSQEDGEYRFGGPENSLEAIIGAFESGIKRVEMDVVATKDGVAVVNHSTKAKSPDGEKMNIHECTWNELKGATGDNGRPLHTLQELLQKFKPFAKLDCELLIDLHSAIVAGPAIKDVQAVDVESQVTFISASPKTLEEVHQKAPKARLGFNALVTPFNACSLLQEPTGSHAPWQIPTFGLVEGKIAVGGDSLPNEEEEYVNYTHPTSIPQHIRDLIKKTDGYFWLVSGQPLGEKVQALSFDQHKKLVEAGEKHLFPVGITTSPNIEHEKIVQEINPDIWSNDRGENWLFKFKGKR